MAFGFPLDIGDRLEVFWDDALVDTTRTTATRRIHHPVYRDVSFVHDRPWEASNNSYHNIVEDADEHGRLVRLYYIAVAADSSTRVCYMQSRDGLTWERPNLGLCEYAGSRDNNIVFNPMAFGFPWDNFMVFRDANPSCPANERYKAVARTDGAFNEDGSGQMGTALGSFFSADGIHFTKGHVITREGAFDTLNCAFWDAVQKKYHLYVRGFHSVTTDRNGDMNVRDIRHCSSTNFIAWTSPQPLDFGEGKEDYALYTNLVQPYPRAPHLLIGFPTRYVERKAWTANYQRLPSPDRRRARMATSPRYGLALTDCIFMFSRDGCHFYREDEAFIRPGGEYADNWVYGDAYPMRGFLETGNPLGDDAEYSFFMCDGQWSGRPMRFLRYTMRVDGFVSRHAAYQEQVLVTKPFVFKGNRLRLNFATSARGYVYVTIRDEAGAVCESVELFGDKVDRIVDFTTETLGGFAGRPVTMTLRMSDADVYAFRFETVDVPETFRSCIVTGETRRVSSSGSRRAMSGVFDSRDHMCAEGPGMMLDATAVPTPGLAVLVAKQDLAEED